MNPFDWRGPEFLTFYAAFGAALWWLLGRFLYWREARAEIPRLDLTDPYEIAMLRGDENEAMRVAAISLVDRGLLKANGDQLKAKDKGAVAHVRRPIEKSLLLHFSASRTASTIFRSPSIQESCESYRESLQNRGLVIKTEDLFRRLPPFAASLSLAVGVSGYKINLAIERERPFGILVLFTILLCIALTLAYKRRRTALGDQVMQDLGTLFERLRARADQLKSGGDTNEVALLAAVYGISSLSSGHAYVKALFPKAADGENVFGSTGCGSAGCGSFGSGCGGSGSGCGGGGGGCGGCGGGH